MVPHHYSQNKYKPHYFYTVLLVTCDIYNPPPKSSKPNLPQDAHLKNKHASDIESETQLELQYFVPESIQLLLNPKNTSDPSTSGSLIN